MDIPGIRYRIIKHLPAFILKFGSVDLAGLGRFRLVGHASSIDHVHAVVYPPFYDVVFEDGRFNGAEDYINYLSKRLGLDDALISEVMTSYTESIRTHLNNMEPVTLEGLGILIKTSDRDVNFESDEAYWGKSAVAELAVSFTPVPRLKEIAEQQHVTTLEDVKKEEAESPMLNTEIQEEDEGLEISLEDSWEETFTESVRVEPAPASIEFVDETELADAPTKEIDEIEQQIQEEQIVHPIEKEEEELPVVETESVAAAAVAEPFTQDNTSVAQSDFDVRRDNVEDKKRHRMLLPFMLGLLILAVPLFWYLNKGDRSVSGMTEEDRQEIPSDRLNQRPETSEEITASGDKERIEEPENELTEEVEAVEEKVTKTTPKAPIEEPKVKPQKEDVNSLNKSKLESITNRVINSGECVIVVGAFSEGPNMRRMMSRLTAKGYKVYVDSARSLSRVGVYSTCQTAELQRNLSDLQSTIEPKSWVLD